MKSDLICMIGNSHDGNKNPHSMVENSHEANDGEPERASTTFVIIVLRSEEIVYSVIIIHIYSTDYISQKSTCYFLHLFWGDD